ncbi:hypothetical protein [Fischerella sp. FACHB-380]|nr:hypothetical protein [Fischerella sp. FACHB-380]MBD2434874.1 hypothetical protein [Fischerella sp. FACHB-380]
MAAKLPDARRTGDRSCINIENDISRTAQKNRRRAAASRRVVCNGK